MNAAMYSSSMIHRTIIQGIPHQTHSFRFVFYSLLFLSSQNLRLLQPLLSYLPIVYFLLSLVEVYFSTRDFPRFIYPLLLVLLFCLRTYNLCIRYKCKFSRDLFFCSIKGTTEYVAIVPLSPGNLSISPKSNDLTVLLRPSEVCGNV